MHGTSEDLPVNRSGIGSPTSIPEDELKLDYGSDPQGASVALVKHFKATHQRPIESYAPDPETALTKHALFENHVAYMAEFLKLTFWALEGDKPLQPCPSEDYLKVWRPSQAELEDPRRVALEKLAEPILQEMATHWDDMAKISRMILRDFDHEPAKVRETEEERLQAVYSQEIHGYLETSPFAHRLIQPSKGNYGVVVMMRTDPWTAPTTFGGIITTFFQNEPSVQAHLNRLDILSEDIALEVRSFKERGERGAFSLLSVGCGPAIEVTDYILKQKPEDLVTMKIALIDIDQKALDFAEKTITAAAKQRGAIVIVTRSPEQEKLADRLLELAFSDGEAPLLPIIVLALRKENAFKEARRYGRHLIDSGRIESVQEKYNMIEELGIRDYVTDETAIYMTHKSSRMLKPRGLMEITNVADINPYDECRVISFKWRITSRNEDRMEAHTDYLDKGVLERKLRDSEEAPVPLPGTPAMPVPRSANRTTEYGVNIRQDPTGLNHIMQVRLLENAQQSS